MRTLKMAVLCVANVIDATARTRKQSDFRHPCLLIRDSELDRFYYTPNFAPAMRFLPTRFRDKGTKHVAVVASFQPISNSSGNNNGNSNDP